MANRKPVVMSLPATGAIAMVHGKEENFSIEEVDVCYVDCVPLCSMRTNCRNGHEIMCASCMIFRSRGCCRLQSNVENIFLRAS